MVGGAIGHEITTHKDLFWQHPICMGRLRGQGELLVGMSHNVEVKRTVDRTKPEYHMVKEPVGSKIGKPSPAAPRLPECTYLRTSRKEATYPCQ